MIHLKNTLWIAAAIFLLFPACKPTEKNYRQAYEIAKQKKIKEKTDPDLDIPELISENTPSTQKIGGIDAKVLTMHLKQHLHTPETHKYNIAVAAYKMQANAIDHVDRLVAAGAKAYIAENKDHILYVVYAGADTPEDAAAAYSALISSHKGQTYPGLDGIPLIIINSSVR